MAKRNTRRTLEDWQNLLAKAESYKEDPNFGHSTQWAEFRNYYRGRFPGVEEHGLLPYNITYAFGQVLIPSVYYQNPGLLVSPRQPGFEIASKVLESIGHWLIQELRVKQILRQAILDAYLCGRGIIKIGYDSEFSLPDRNLVAELLGEDVEQVEPMLGGAGMPWIQRIDPDMFLVPFGSIELPGMDWVDHIVLRPLDEVKKDRLYKNVSNMEGNFVTRILNNRNKTSFYQQLIDQTDYVEIHEIADAKRRERLALVWGHEKFIRPPADDILQVDGLPYVDLCFNEDPEYYWCPSDAALIEPQQLEMNEARTLAMKHRRIALARLLVTTGTLAPAEAEKLLGENVGPIINVDGPVDESRIREFRHNIPQDVVFWTDLIREDAREILGIGRVQAGKENQGRRTATEVERVQQAHDLRMGMRRDRVGDCLQNLMRKLFQICQKMWSTEKVVQIVGVEGARHWVSLKGSDIAGEYNIKVDVESTVPSSKDSRKRDIVQLIQAVGQHPGVNMDYLLRMLLKEFDWIDVNKMLPMAQSGVVPYDQFQQGQQNLQNNPQELQARQGAVAQQLPIPQIERALQETGVRG